MLISMRTFVGSRFASGWGSRKASSAFPLTAKRSPVLRNVGRTTRSSRRSSIGDAMRRGVIHAAAVGAGRSSSIASTVIAARLPSGSSREAVPVAFGVDVAGPDRAVEVDGSAEDGPAEHVASPVHVGVGVAPYVGRDLPDRRLVGGWQTDDGFAEAAACVRGRVGFGVIVEFVESKPRGPECP